jgi:hypothetical protein
MACPQFSISFQMRVTMPDGATGIPPVLVSLLAPVIAPYADFNGLQGVVTIVGRSVYYVSIDFPSTITTLKYPVACADSTTMLVDVRAMSDGAAVFTTAFAAYLAAYDGALYVDVNNAIDAFMGVEPATLVFTAPSLTLYGA